MVNLCSGSATSDPPGPPGEGGWGVAYSASKAAFGRLAGAINAEYLGRGVRAFNLDPGFVVTEGREGAHGPGTPVPGRACERSSSVERGADGQIMERIGPCGGSMSRSVSAETW
ncbi:hypothetical protein [Actinomadura sp. 3N407]|uniref:hypothetical protein n=1 Tax=Actinomadura sp. 3N407 TaxID=3457423 RepID=UPI003FCD7F59